MLKSVEDIKKAVRVILDEDEDIGQLTMTESDTDALQTDAITEAMILRAADKVHEMAPMAYVTTAAKQSEEECYDVDNALEMHLPDNLLRVLAVKIGSWRHEVCSVVTPESPEYLMQSSRWAGVRATKRMPVAAIAPDMYAGGNKLMMYPGRENADDEVMVMLILKSSIDENGELLVADRCYDAMLYMLASLYYQTIGEQQRASVMAMESAEMIGMNVGKAEQG